MPLRFIRLLPAACFPLLWASPLAAQTTSPPAPESAESEEGDPGDLGPFDLTGSLEVGIGFDDNVYAQRNDKVSDGLWIISPEIGLTLEGEVVDLKLYSDAEIGRYWSESSEDYDDAELGASASFDLGEEREIFAGASYAWEHEDRSSPDAVNGLEPQQYTNPRAHLGYAATYAPYEVRLGGTFERLDFDDVNAIPQPIDGDLRDRDLYTGGLRVGKAVSERWQVFGQGYADFRNYDQEINAGGQDRDSEGGTLAAGLRYRVGKSMDFEVLGGLMYQSYDDLALMS